MQTELEVRVWRRPGQGPRDSWGGAGGRRRGGGGGEAHRRRGGSFTAQSPGETLTEVSRHVSLTPQPERPAFRCVRRRLPSWLLGADPGLAQTPQE